MKLSLSNVQNVDMRKNFKEIVKLMKLSKKDQTVKLAFEKGYRVINGVPTNPRGKALKGSIECGYWFIKPFKHLSNISFHRLAAYQKYGNLIFNKEKEVRHLDGNSLKNNENNIDLGTHQENMLDQLPRNRFKKSIKAANRKRRFTDEEIDQIRTDYLNTRSYKLVMEKWNISSKGTLYYIINNNYVTEKK